MNQSERRRYLIQYLRRTLSLAGRHHETSGGRNCQCGEFRLDLLPSAEPQLHRPCDTILNHTGIVRKLDKILIRMNAALPGVEGCDEPAAKLGYYREVNGISKEELGARIGISGGADG